MIFSELYSAYYNTVAGIISSIIDGEHSERELQRIVSERAFGESVLTVMPSLKSGKWQLVHPDMTTPLEHKPTMPLTVLQRRWLKAISLDRRIRLFAVTFDGLDDVEPLFTEDDYYVYDKYGDGDPFDDAGYVERFRMILSAIKQGSQLRIEMTDRKGRSVYVRCQPTRLEYSAKDDKFRLLTSGCRFISTINLARITSCVPYIGGKPLENAVREAVRETLTLKILDERNALERGMLHFAHFEKQAEKLDGKHYLVRIKYERSDEAEMVIRILSFGPLVEVVGPDSFRNLVIEKLKKQKNCGLK